MNYPPIDISEDGGLTWQKMPQWAKFFLELGRNWPRKTSGPNRTIRIISIPTKAPVAGLVALGAVAADLCDANANDKSRHFDSLLGFARQYLTACKTCIYRCKPNLRKCGYNTESTGILRNINIPRNKYYVQPTTDFLKKDLRINSKLDGTGVGTGFYTPDGVDKYYLDEGVPLSQGRFTTRFDTQPFEQIFPNLNFNKDNLTTSYSALCFAGIASGEIVTQKEFMNFMFKIGGGKSLSTLLPIYGWDNGNTELSRIIYYNSRGKGSFSQTVNSPNLVIADGTDALNSVLSEQKKLGSADVIALVSRIIERSKMEEFSDRLESLTQWYDKVDLTDPIPAGCHQVEYRRRFQS